MSVELHDLVPRLAVGALRFPVSARFVDVRGAMIEDLQRDHGLPQWSYGTDHVEVYREDRTLTITVRSREVRVSFEATDDLDTIATIARKTFEYALGALHVSEVVFIGARTHW